MKSLINTLLLTLCAAFACPAAAADTLPPIRVGLTAALSGEYEAIGTEYLRGVKFWVEDVNERGALLGRRVELVHYDDESNAQRAAALYEKLITEDRVDLLIGPYSSTLTLTVSDVTERHGFPMPVEATAPIVFERGHRTLFGIYPTADNYMRDVLDIAAEKGLVRLALAHEQEAFPAAVAAGVRRMAADRGLRLVADESYPPNAGNLEPTIRRIVAAEPEVIVVGGYVDDAIQFVRALRATGYAPKLIAFSGGPAVPEFGEALGDDSHGVLVTTQWMRDGHIPGAFDFGFRYRQRYGHYPSYNAAGGYAAGQIIEAAVRLAGSTEQGAVREQLAAMKFQSVLGPYRVDERGRQTGKPFYTIQWQGPHRSLVYPPDIARWPMVYPFPDWHSR